jgi:hypothetical protein
MRHGRPPPAIFFLVTLPGIGETESAACEEPQEHVDCPRTRREEDCEDDKPMLDPRALPFPLKKSNDGYWEYLHRIG